MLRWAGFLGLATIASLALGCAKPPPPSAPTLVVPVLDAPARAGGPFERPVERRFASGERVEVLWNGRWWPAVVLESHRSDWLVHYEGYADTWDETVEAERIRERGLGPSDSEDDDHDTPEEPGP